MTPYETQQRKNRIRDAELYGWQSVCALSDEQFSVACNGCGPDSWPEEKRRKLTKWLATFLPAFDVHDVDFAYRNDGSRELFDAANRRLRKNCLLLADEKYAWYNPMRYLARRAGKLIAEMCQDFGWLSWKAAYNKNQNNQTRKGNDK